MILWVGFGLWPGWVGFGFNIKFCTGFQGSGLGSAFQPVQCSNVRGGGFGGTKAIFLSSVR